MFLSLLFLPLILSSTHALDCVVEQQNRIDCYPEKEPKEQELCEARGCCFDSHLHLTDVPWCFFPLDYSTYKVNEFKATSYGFSGNLSLPSNYSHPHGTEIKDLSLNIFFEQENRLRIQLKDASKDRFEVPISTPDVGTAVEHPLYDIDIKQERFGIVVTRKSSKTVLFNSTIAPMLYADQFLQISTTLPSSNVYGLGERHEGSRINDDGTTYKYWAHDGIPQPKTNLYGDHPIYYCIEDDGNAHGVFFLNSNAREVVAQPAPALTWRSIGGIMDFYIFLGPTPEMVVQQYTDVVGKPFLPPSWSLGFHLCRYGYNSSNVTQNYVDKMRAASIPQDVQWNDIDYMIDHRDFTYDHQAYHSLPQLVSNLHANNQHYVMIIDPGISNQQPNGSYPPYDQGISSGIFVLNSNGTAPTEGQVWPGKTVFPDFSHPMISNYWEQQLSAYHSEIPFDGVWIDMNEPSNFVSGSTSGCPNNSYENPPYVPQIIGHSLSSRTLCVSSLHYNNQLHYNMHSLYGLLEMKATNKALVNIRNKRPFVISRSTFPSAGMYGGHWSGDIRSTWSDLKQSISSIINFNLFGVPMVGADICGFGGDTTEELCTRWMQLGAFYPFSRNHNSLRSMNQAPVDFSETAQKNMRDILKVRYYYLPYLYSLFFSSHVTGGTVARGLFSEFPKDIVALHIDTQFMWGSGLLISPVLEQGATTLTAYFPAGYWYFVYGPFGKKLDSSGTSHTFDVSLSDVILHARGGSILPTQEPSMTTVQTRLNPLTLIVAPDEKGNADGFVYWDDGDSLHTYENKNYLHVLFHLNDMTLVSEIVNDGGSIIVVLGDIYIFDVSSSVKSVLVDGKSVEFTRRQYNVIHFECSLNLSKPFKIELQYVITV